MLLYSGKDLETYKRHNLEMQDSWNSRDFCILARQYLEASTEKILAICGLRGTGKTVGLLQAAQDLDAAYILAQKGDDKTGNDYINILKSIPNKCIIFDEYGWIQNKRQLDYYLLTAVQNGKRIIITGTESITLHYLRYGALHHRVTVLHTTLFPYDEYKRVYQLSDSQKTCDDYLLEGGIFKEYAVKDYASTKEYVEDAIVQNLSQYLKKEMSEEKARAITYAVLFKAVCPSNLSEIPMLRASKTTIPNFLDAMGINTEIVIHEHDLNRVADIFENTGIITRVPNLVTESTVKERYYINNPSLTSQLIMAAYNLPSLDNSVLGYVFEACVMTQLAANKLVEHDIYFFDNSGLQNEDRKELDIIITDTQREHVYFFECKHAKSHKIKTTSTMLSGYLEKQFFSDADIDGRYVVYNGDPCVKTYDIGDILFTPLNSIVNDYFLFADHVSKLTKEDDQSLSPY